MIETIIASLAFVAAAWLVGRGLERLGVAHRAGADRLAEALDAARYAGETAVADWVEIQRDSHIEARWQAKFRAGWIRKKAAPPEPTAEERKIAEFMAEHGVTLSDEDAMSIEWALRRLQGHDSDQGDLAMAEGILERFKFPRDMVA